MVEGVLLNTYLSKSSQNRKHYVCWLLYMLVCTPDFFLFICDSIVANFFIICLKAPLMIPADVLLSNVFVADMPASVLNEMTVLEELFAT